MEVFSFPYIINTGKKVNDTIYILGSVPEEVRQQLPAEDLQQFEDLVKKVSKYINKDGLFQLISSYAVQLAKLGSTLIRK